MNFPTEDELVYITKRERDALRKFNGEMRALLKRLLTSASVTPLQENEIFLISYEGIKCLNAQEQAGLK